MHIISFHNVIGDMKYFVAIVSVCIIMKNVIILKFYDILYRTKCLVYILCLEEAKLLNNFKFPTL